MTPRFYADWWEQVLVWAPHLDLIAPQDSMGAQGNSFENVSTFLGELAAASRRASRKIYSNVELFEVWPTSCQWSAKGGICKGRHPAPFERIRAQMANEAPLVDELIAWEWHSCLSPHGTTNLTAQLYAEYLQYVGRPPLPELRIKTDERQPRHYRGWAFAYNISDQTTADGCPVQQPFALTTRSGVKMCCVLPVKAGDHTCSSSLGLPPCCASATGCGSTPHCAGAPLRSATWLYPNGTVNMLPTGIAPCVGGNWPCVPDALVMGDMAQRGVQVQYHSPCWNAYCGGPSCNTSAPIGSNTTILNKNAVEAALERMVVAPLQHGFLGGVALDECCGGPWLNNGMEQVAKAAYHKARAAFPSMQLHAWTSDPWLIGDLMADGTVDLALIEAYTYCPGCGDWPNSTDCCGSTIEHYFRLLDYAKANGFINRTVMCYGYILGRSPLNPNGWTEASLRATMLRVKARYPELRGVAMYGMGPGRGMGRPLDMSDVATMQMIRAANMLMLELYPD